MYVRKYNVYNILFPDSSRNFFFSVFCRLISYKRISSENSRIGCDRFGCCHSNMGFIHSAGCPDTFAFLGIWHGGVTHWIVWKLDLYVRQNRSVFSRLVFWMNDCKFFGCVMSGTRIIISCDYG